MQLEEPFASTLLPAFSKVMLLMYFSTRILRAQDSRADDAQHYTTSCFWGYGIWMLRTKFLQCLPPPLPGDPESL